MNPFSSVLWLDQPDAPERLERLAARRDVTPHDVALLRRFREDGYFDIALDPREEPLDALVSDFDRLWREKPDDVLVAYEEPVLRRMSQADEAQYRRPAYRLHDLHSRSAAARRLYLHPRLHRLAALILGQRAVAIQSIAFEFGSTQALHRDPVYVVTPEAGHLLACWIALEDIHEDSGPLTYIPGSHTMPPYEYAPGVFLLDPDQPDQIQREQEWLAHESRARGLAPKAFCARKGEVLFWHSGLYHGGGIIRDPRRTRRSLVIHFSAAASYRVVVHRVRERDDGAERDVLYGTKRRIGSRKAIGFAPPLSRDFDWLPTISNRLGATFGRRRASSAGA